MHSSVPFGVESHLLQCICFIRDHILNRENFEMINEIQVWTIADRHSYTTAVQTDIVKKFRFFLGLGL